MEGHMTKSFLFITVKTQRILRILTEHGPLQAQSSAERSSMHRAAELLGRHEGMGGVETNADMHSMLVLLDVAQQCKSSTEAGKIAYFNTNWDKVSGYWHDGFRAQETFARELGLPDWVQVKVYDGTWDPTGGRAAAADSALQDVRSDVDLVTDKPAAEVRTIVDGKHGIEKTMRNSKAVYIWTRALEGEEDEFSSLGAAREAAGAVITHVPAAGHGRKTNDPTVSQRMQNA
jgi:hypothetical protein